MEAVLRTVLHETPIETRIHFFFQKINCKKKKIGGVLNLISYKRNMNANNTNKTAKEIFGKCV